ncbi:DUF6531 domain-containing protein [Gallaecimonas kandeliae]|uniref:RHS repeat-associated core domain-containing protein n=1 Tax=Gallaecimonas kandeliae TaxID=3029055 RepID=UPI00264A1FCC|nr:RHS repeat-associated core domain-containing protein [Gallaecimonas kandeliae]WKE65730.1 DUF6531 domain-containing protein [Gallaecimonas kandeliae]
MSKDTHIQIQGAGGSYRFSPAQGAQAQGQPIRHGNRRDWRQWLSDVFGFTFGGQEGRWQQLPKLWDSEELLGNNPDHVFAGVAEALSLGKLAVAKVPAQPTPAKKASAAPGAAETGRSQQGAAQAKAPAPAPAGGATSAGVDATVPAADIQAQQCQGDPVSPSTGEEILALTDFEARAALPLRWQRLYRSGLSDQDWGLGHGWYNPLLRRLWQDEEHCWVEDQEGRAVRFPRLAPGQFGWQAATGQRLEYKADGRLLLSDPDGSVWTFLLFEDGFGRLDSRLDRQGRQWLFYYDDKARLTRIDLGPDHWLELGYQGRHISGVLLRRQDHKEVLARYRYDAKGDLQSASANGGSERYGYDGHLLVVRRRPSGYRLFFQWQGQGPEARCLRSWGEDGRHEVRLDYQDGQTLVTQAGGAQQLFAFDAAGRVTERMDADGSRQQWHFDELGRLREHRLADGRSHRFDFDAKGRPACDWLPDGRCHRRFFNDLGFCIAERLPDGRYLSRRLDAMGRLLEERRADGSHWHYRYDSAGWLKEGYSDQGQQRLQGWDGEGRLLASQAQGELVRYAYDGAGRLRGALVQDLVIEREYQGDKLVAEHRYPEQSPQQKASRHYRYDQGGRLVQFQSATGRQHGFDYAGIDKPLRYHRPDGKTVHYGYDQAERLTEVVRPDGGRWQLGYDQQGRVERCQAPDGRDIRFRYDAAGQVVHREQPGTWVQHLKRDAGGRVQQQASQGKGRQPVTKRFQHDHLGRLVRATTEGRRLDWQYDGQGNVSRHGQDQFAVHYRHQAGRLEAMTLPDGTQIQYRHDDQGRWQQLLVNGEPMIDRRFDGRGQEQQRQASHNVQHQVWDRNKLLVSRQWQGQEAVTRRYSWDDDNRLEWLEDSRLGERRFQRDAAGQLLGDGRGQYRYDDGGNRLEADGQKLFLDRLAGKRRFDELGAEIAWRGEEEERRRFDAEGCLVAFDKGGMQLRYGYDALGRRAWRQGPDGQVNYLWDGDLLLGEERGGAWQWFLRDPETGEPLLTLVDGKPYYYELDWRALPVRLWSGDGQVAWQGDSDAWGQVTESGDIRQPLRLPGQFADELSGLYFNRFRDYDPRTGRYLTPDPLGIKGGLNSYRYTPNPVDYIDPLGLCEVSSSLSQTRGGSAGNSDALPAMQELKLANSKELNDSLNYDTIFAGHGSVDLKGPKRTVPEGASLTVYAVAGASISDSLGVAIETRNVPEDVFRRTFQAGEEMPDIWLWAPDGDVSAQPSSVTVDRPIPVTDLMEAGGGDYHFAACLHSQGHENNKVVHDDSGTYHYDRQTKEIFKHDGQQWQKEEDI